MTAPYDLARLRRLLLLLPAAARRLEEGLPIDDAVRLTGARSRRQLLEDVEALGDLWASPDEGETAVTVEVIDDAFHLAYAEPFHSPPALSLAEGAVLLAALAPVEEGAGRPARAAARRLRRAIPEPLRPAAEALAKGLDVAAEPPGPWAGALREAIASRVETVLEYRAVADGAAARRVVEPRLLLQHEGTWYLAAWNVEKAEEHLYRLDRLVTVEPGTRVFGAHKGPPEGRYRRGGRLYFESGAEREVTLRFRGAAAKVAAPRFGARAAARADGTAAVKVAMTPGNHLAAVVLGYGGDCTVEGPPDVVEGFRERVAALRRLYG